MLISFANTQPVLRIRAARYVVLPPGAAAMSTTDSPSCGANAMHGKKDEAPCTEPTVSAPPKTPSHRTPRQTHTHARGRLPSFPRRR